MAAPPPPTLLPIVASEAELLLQSLINQERGGRQLRRLKMQSKLLAVARRHSANMAQAGKIYHNSRLAKNIRKLSWSMAAENVGVGDVLEELHQAFMDSRPHRQNILLPRFRKVGVGTVSSEGLLWVTVVFIG